VSDAGVSENGQMNRRFVGVPELTDVPRVAVVVDVMRAFTVAAWAFSRGVERIVLASSEGEARALKERRPGWLALKEGAPYAADCVARPDPITGSRRSPT
jgi:2-phosphosulfolactate phosphatase